LKIKQTLEVGLLETQVTPWKNGVNIIIPQNQKEQLDNFPATEMNQNALFPVGRISAKRAGRRGRNDF
jgi:hypothetical protein